MKSPQTQSRTLTASERAHLDALAGEFAFWRDVRKHAKEYNGALTAAQYARLCEAMTRYPSVLNGQPVRNRRAKDGQILCWRSKAGHCRAVASEVVDGVAVCAAHVQAQRDDAATYAARKAQRTTTLPRKEQQHVDPATERAKERTALKNLIALLDPPDQTP